MSTTIMLVFAFVCAVIATIFNPRLPAETPWYGRFHFGWAAIAFYIATMLFK